MARDKELIISIQLNTNLSHDEILARCDNNLLNEFLLEITDDIEDVIDSSYTMSNL